MQSGIILQIGFTICFYLIFIFLFFNNFVSNKNIFTELHNWLCSYVHVAVDFILITELLQKWQKWNCVSNRSPTLHPIGIIDLNMIYTVRWDKNVHI